MHAWIRRALCAMGLAAGIILLGFGLAESASADGDTGPTTSGEGGALSGNQTDVGVTAPVDLSGNQVTVIGQDNTASSTGTATTDSGSTGSTDQTTSGQDGIGSGNQTGVDAQAPVDASGNQVTVIGQDNTASSTGTATTDSGSTGSTDQTTSGQDGIGSGNQTGVDAQAPVDASGNQVTVIGQDNTADSTSGTSTGAGTSGGDATTTGEGGLLAGNQTGIGISAPLDLSGNQLTVIGQDNTDTATGDAGSGSTGGSTSGEATTSGEDAVGSGNQTAVDAQAPVDASGNQVTVIGQDNTNTATGTSSTESGATAPGQTTTGEGGIVSGNQTPVSVQVPVDASGNQVTVIGQDDTNTSTSGSGTGGTTPGGATSPPGAGDVSPPMGGTPSGGPEPGASVLPSTGLGGGLLPLALLGLVLLLGGAGLTRREVALR